MRSKRFEWVWPCIWRAEGRLIRQAFKPSKKRPTLDGLSKR